MTFHLLTATTKKATSGIPVLLNNHSEYEVYLGYWNKTTGEWKVAGISDYVHRERFTHYAFLPSSFIDMPSDDFPVSRQVILLDAKGMPYIGLWDAKTKAFTVDGWEGQKAAAAFAKYAEIPELPTVNH